jgi:hypothetical protein
MEEEKTYGYFMQVGATVHTANYSINVLNWVFENRLISHRLWLQGPPHLKPCDFSLGENLKNSLYSNNPCTFDELKDKICERIHLSRVVNKNWYQTIFSGDLKFLRGKGDILSTNCDVEFL